MSLRSVGSGDDGAKELGGGGQCAVCAKPWRKASSKRRCSTNCEKAQSESVSKRL